MQSEKSRFRWSSGTWWLRVLVRRTHLGVLSSRRVATGKHRPGVAAPTALLAPGRSVCVSRPLLPAPAEFRCCMSAPFQLLSWLLPVRAFNISSGVFFLKKALIIKGQTPYEAPRVFKFAETENGMVVARCWREAGTESWR